MTISKMIAQLENMIKYISIRDFDCKEVGCETHAIQRLREAQRSLGRHERVGFKTGKRLSRTK